MPLSFPAEIAVPVEQTRKVEISIRGQWSTVRGIALGPDTLIVRGRWLRTAVVHEEEWLDHEIHDPEACRRALTTVKVQGRRPDLLTFVQKLPHTATKYSYHKEDESVAAILLTTFAAWWESLPQESRKNVRRAEKRGVVVRTGALDDAMIEGIIGVNNDSPVRQNIPFAHYGKNFAQVRKDQSSFLDRSEFIGAYADGEMIGFLKMVYRGQIASILQLLPKASQRDRRPANALLAKAVEICAQKGMTHLTYGLYNYGNKRESSLKEFKVRNGFQEVILPRYYIPLTWLGRLAMVTGCHRGLHGILPPAVISAIVKLRAKVYKISDALSRCSLTPERPNCNRQMECSNPPAGSNN